MITQRNRPYAEIRIRVKGSALIFLTYHNATIIKEKIVAIVIDVRKNNEFI